MRDEDEEDLFAEAGFDFGDQDLNLYWRDKDEDLLAEAGFDFDFSILILMIRI